MVYNKYSVRKYLVSTTLATAFVFSSLLAGGASAHGGPSTDATPNNTSVTEEKQVEQTTSTQVSKGNLTQGDSGEAVKEVQKSLNNQGESVSTDGIFGGATEKSVKNIQSNNGLSVDGVVGPATKEALASTGNAETSENNDTEVEVEIEDVTTTENSNDQKEETVTNTSVDQSDVVSIANSVVGTPYTPGGTTPAGFDSSGFVNYVFDEAGVSLNRTHNGMWANNGTHVDNPSVGDVVFFEDTYKNGVSHSGIYLGDNQMAHAGTSQTGVEVTTMSYDYWQNRYIGAKTFN